MIGNFFNFLNSFSNRDNDNVNTSLDSDTDNTEKYLDIINNTLNDVNGIIFIKKEHYSESDCYKCKLDDFNEFNKNIIDKWFDIQYIAWEYIIWKTIKNNKSTIFTILKKFKFEEIKNED